MRYFPDENEEKPTAMRDYRKARDSYDFSLEPRHMTLFIVVFLIMAVLLFSIGYVTGRSSALKEVASAPVTETPAEVVGVPPEGETPEVNFYETLGEGEGGSEVVIPAEEMNPSTPTTPTEAAPPTDVASPTTTGGKKYLYFLQIFSTKDKAKAETLLASLKKDGYGAYIKESAEGYYRVRIKWYNTKEEAEKAKKELLAKKQYKDYFINSDPEIRIGEP